MTQSTNRLLDEFAKLMNDMAGVAQGVRREVETAVKSQAERFVGEMDLVQREEFEAVRDMAAKARQENEALKKRIEALEARAGGTDTGVGASGRRRELGRGELFPRGKTAGGSGSASVPDSLDYSGNEQIRICPEHFERTGERPGDAGGARRFGASRRRVSVGLRPLLFDARTRA